MMSGLMKEPLACMKLCLTTEALPMGVSLNERGRSDRSWAKDDVVKYGSLRV